jgi:Tfp pilus assembly protein PilV
VTARTPASRGISLIEVMIALAVLFTGAVIGLTMVASTSARGEITREQALAYKACQDAMEALMSMDKPTLLAQKTWQQSNSRTSSFTVTLLQETDGSSPRGEYRLTDVSTRSDATAPAETLLEIRVSFVWKKINIQLVGRRHLP